MVVYGDIPGTVVAIDAEKHAKSPYHVRTARGCNWVALCVISRAPDPPAVSRKLAAGPVPKETLF